MLDVAEEAHSANGAVLLDTVVTTQALEAYLDPDVLIIQRNILNSVELFDMEYGFLRS